MRGRAVAVSGIVYAATIVAGTLLAGPSGLTERAMEWEPPSAYMPGLAAARETFVASMWTFHVSSVALAAFGLAWGRRWPALFLAASAGAFLVETTMILGVGLGVAPRWAAASGEEAARLEALAAALIAFRVHMALLASLLLAAGALAIGAELWRGGPRWLAAIAFVSGALGALGAFSLVSEPFSAVRTAGIVVWTGFAAIAGVRALRPAQK